MAKPLSRCSMTSPISGNELPRIDLLPTIIMAIFPLVVVAVNAVFGSIVFRQYVRRRRPHQLAWCVAFGLGFLAAGFYVLFLGFHHNDVLFKLYYTCGGLLMAAYLGLGSVYLNAPRRLANGTAVVLLVASCIGISLLFDAGTNPGRLVGAANSVGPGTNALGPGAWKVAIALLNSFGAIAVIAGAIYSAYRTVKRNAPVKFLWANILIAVGTFLAALAGGVADQGAFAGSFWLLLAVGFMVLFCGFLLTMMRIPGDRNSRTALPEVVPSQR